MSKPTKSIKLVIGKPKANSNPPLVNNGGIVNLLTHFDMDVSIVTAYQQELVDAGWIEPNIPDEQFEKVVTATAKEITEKVSEVGTVKPPKNPKDRLSPQDEPEYMDEVAMEPNPMFVYTEDEEKGAASYYKRELRKTENRLTRLQAEAFIGKQKVNRMAEAAASVKPTPINMKVVSSGKRSGKFHNVLPISDLHFGEVVQPQISFGFNKYNPEIAKNRLTKLFEENYRFASLYGCDELHILLLGDMISGEIHDELRETNAYTAPKCVSLVNSLLTGLILEYAKLYKKVTVSCVVGNHSRTGKKLQAKNRSQDNYEHIIYSTIKDRCTAEAKNITVEFDDEATVLITEIGNQRWMLEHGDRYNGSQAAAGAINTVLRKIGTDLRHNHADVAIMGHWHIGAEGAIDAREDGNMTKVYINPSLVGPDDFAVTTLHAYYPAESNVFITDGEQVVAKVAINLSDIQK